MGGDPLQRGPRVVVCDGERVLWREPVVDGDGDQIGGGDEGGEVIVSDAVEG